MQPEQIFINRNNQKYGSYSLDDVNDYLAAGHLQPSDAAWFEGASAWMLLSQVPNVKLPHVKLPPPPPVVPIQQHNVKPKSAIITYGGGCLLVLFGIALLGGVIGTFQDKQKEQQAQAALLAKQQQKREAARKRAVIIAANPKLAAAERDDQRKREIQRQKEQQATQERERQVKRQAERAEKQRGERIETYLKKSFGHPGFEVTWYLAVKRQYSFVGNRVNVHTNLSYVPSSHPLHEEWKRLANANCVAISGYIYDKANPDKNLKEIQVLSSDGRELASCP